MNILDPSLEILQRRMTMPHNLPILLLGAGFSLGAVNGDDVPLVLGKTLVKDLYENVLKPNICHIDNYDGDKELVNQALYNGDLRGICQRLRDFKLVKERNAYLTSRFKNCHWDDVTDFEALACYPWPYIFTLNIDDLVENIYKKVGKDLIVWTDMTPTYDENYNSTILVKLHGDVGHSDGYVFDDDEYQKFISQEPRILTKFADEYVSRDLIVLGTQFQEEDLKIALNKLFNEKCISTNFQYFFISPDSFSRAIKNKIQENENFHYIKMSNIEFLKKLRSWKIKHDSKKMLLLSNSFADWNKELDESRGLEKEYKLYYGRSPEARDFFYKIDISRKAERNGLRRKENYNVEFSFKTRLKSATSFLVTIHGEAYVGKSCLAMRLLSICAESGYQCFYTQNTTNRTIEKLREYFLQQVEGDLFAVCLENAAGAYYTIPKMLKDLNDNVTLVIITTSLESAHQTKKHNLQFMENVWEDYAISEKVTYPVAEDIFRKLKGENHLGKLQKHSRKASDVKKVIRNLKDFINVLWYAHEGRHFIEFFDDWYKQHEDERQINLFNMLTFYASLGCLSFPISFIPELARALRIKNFSYNEFQKSFKDFWIEKGGIIRLRYVRLFANVVNRHISKSEKVEWIKVLMILLSRRTYERDHSQYNLMYETIAKIRTIEKYTDLDKHTIRKMFEDVESECKHLSYYWIQRCIIYSQCEMFEEASNAISNAEGTRKYSTYQIVHADAKNDMARGIWCLENKKAEGEMYFNQGRMKMRSLINDRGKYKNAFSFSVHAYINMSMKYYRLLGTFPNDLEWMNMKRSMLDLLDVIKFPDRIITNLVDRFVQYANDSGYDEDVKGMKGRLESKWKPSSENLDYEIDELPC